MDNGNNTSERPEIGRFIGFDYVEMWVGNAKQAANFYVTKMGYSPFAYKNLETGSRDIATHVVKNGDAVFAFTCPLNNDTEFSQIHGAHLTKRGDGVRDVAFTVENCEHTYKIAISRGAKSVQEPVKIEDKDGYVIKASVWVYEETIHSFIERSNYRGTFLPGFAALPEDPVNDMFGLPKFGSIDHIAANQRSGDIDPTVEWYVKMLDFHRFWSIEDSMIATEYSSLKPVVVADFDEVIKLNQNAPVQGKRKSQIQEYIDYYYGPGIQHIAIKVDDIISVVDNLTKRGMKFLEIPDKYYANLRARLEHTSLEIKEDIDSLERLKILMDYDDKGYLLQIFTKTVEDRPTLFHEFIQRHNHNGFGVGNFKGLFEAIQKEQEKRGNLV